MSHGLGVMGWEGGEGAGLEARRRGFCKSAISSAVNKKTPPTGGPGGGVLRPRMSWAVLLRNARVDDVGIEAHGGVLEQLVQLLVVGFALALLPTAGAPPDPSYPSP